MLLDLGIDTDLSLLDFPVDEPGCHYCGRDSAWRCEKVCPCDVCLLICSHCKAVMESLEAKAAMGDKEMSCTTCGFVAPNTKLSELVRFSPLKR